MSLARSFPSPNLPMAAMMNSPDTITPGMRVNALSAPHTAASHGCPRRRSTMLPSVRQMNSASVYAQQRNTLSGLSRKYATESTPQRSPYSPAERS